MPGRFVMQGRIRNYGLYAGAMVALVLTMVSFYLLASSKASAENEVVTQTSVTVASSCVLSSVTGSAHSAEVSASTYRDNIGETIINVICNDANGYAVYAVGYTNTEFGRNDMLGQNTGRTIPTGVVTQGLTSGWAMRLTAVDNNVAPTIATGYNAYHEVPDDFTKVASYSSSTTINPAGSSFKTTYATYVAPAQAADTYVGKVKYTFVHPADTTNTPCVGNYMINYNSNGGSGNMDSQTACVDRAITLLPDGFTPPVPVAENQFAVWNTAADGSGYTYVPGQSVTNLASAGGTVTLYAQWAPKYMQDFTSNICQIVASENPFTVYDKRDGNDYTVRYLKGACWMTQNLRITGTVNAQNSNFSTYSNVNVCEGDLTDGNSYDQPRCHDSGNTTNGVWYNYAAASAKNILNYSNSTPATEDICPAGWNLPSHGASSAGSIDSLVSNVSTDVAAFSPVNGGNYYNGSLRDTGSGSWWSTTTYNTHNRYYLNFSDGNLSSNGLNRDIGYYVRCVRL